MKPDIYYIDNIIQTYLTMHTGERQDAQYQRIFQELRRDTILEYEKVKEEMHSN